MKRFSQRQLGHRGQRGASIMEMVTVVAVMMVLSAIAIMSTAQPSKNSTANSAADTVVDTLRQARQTAVGRRRNVLVAFTGTNTITTTVQTLPGEPPVTPTVVQLNSGAVGGLTYYLYPGLPNTPMAALGFGNNNALDFESVNGGAVGNSVMYTSSGSLVGSGAAAAANYYALGNNNPVNATIYIAVPGSPITARAITVLGSTGQVRPYYWNGTSWQE
jgi:hypothetical protein